MPTERPEIEELLLDFHLDRLDEATRAWLENELRLDSALADKNRQLGRVLQPLDYWQPAAPTDHLAARILEQARLQRLPRVLGVEPGTETHYRARFLPMRDMIAAAACILLLVGVFVPGLSTMRARSQRAACASNLRAIFAGTAVYREVFEDCLPYAGEVHDAAWLPTGAGDHPYASNSRHSYLLLKNGFGPRARDFICPADTHAVPMDVENFMGREDFARAANISYDALNLTAGHPNVRPRRSLVYMGDANPLFTKARFNAAVDPDTANSLAHGRDGQTLLMLDGTAHWANSPLVGVDADNIWLAGGIRSYTGIESRVGPNDVQLIPGFPVTDPDFRR